MIIVDDNFMDQATNATASTSVSPEVNSSASAVVPPSVAAAPAPVVSNDPKTSVEAAKPNEVAKADAQPVTESYDFKAPEGVSLDQELLGEFKGIAKEAGLKGEVASKIFELGPKMMQKMQEAQAKSFADTREKWVSEVKSDAEIGGNKCAESQELAIRATRFLESKSPGIKDLLEKSGWGDNPVLFKAFRAIGQALGEDSIVDGSGGKATPSLGKLFYPTMQTK